MNKYFEEKIELAAVLINEETNRRIEVYTDEPGIQVYTGNNLDFKHKKNSGICLETQHFPNSPNQPTSPSTELSPASTSSSSMSSISFALSADSLVTPSGPTSVTSSASSASSSPSLATSSPLTS